MLLKETARRRGNEVGVREAHILSEGQHVRGKIVMKVE